jgi:rod shape-determining protein MreD
MKWVRIYSPAIVVFLLQYYLSDLLAIRSVRADFIFIYVLYLGIWRGSFTAVIAGFVLGFLSDLAGVGSYFGLSSIVYVLVGYLAGFLQGRYQRWIPFYFHLSWIIIGLFCFFVYAYIRYQFLFETDLAAFLGMWLMTAGYTFGFLAILQFLFPLKEIG